MGNEATNRSFFNRWKSYHCIVSELDTYKHTSQALTGELADTVLDVGNGGVINYDLSAIQRLIVVDLAEELSQKKDWPGKVEFRQGSAVNLPLESESVDVVLFQMLVHHLAERSYQDTVQRTRLAFQEVRRVLRPGGKFVIIESGLNCYWSMLERALFPFLRLFVLLIKHPMVYQWNWKRLQQELKAEGYRDIQCTPIPQGRWIILFGLRWPTLLSPLRLHKFVCYK